MTEHQNTKYLRALAEGKTLLCAYDGNWSSVTSYSDAVKQLVSGNYMGWSFSIAPEHPACGSTTFALGDLVRKKSGAAWHGRVVGTYSTSLTPEGYAIESSAHPGSVQIYPVAALEKVPE